MTHEIEMEPVIIKVIGIGNTGINAVKHMKNSSIKGVEFIYTQTDTLALQQLDNALKGTQLLFLIADIHEDTSAKTAIAIAKLARKLNILTLSVVTAALDSDSQQKKSIAENTMLELEKHIDSNIIIPNSLLLYAKTLNTVEQVKAENVAFLNTIQAITDLIVYQGMIGFDYADMKTVMSRMGRGIAGVGIATGGNKAKEATIKAISYFLLACIDLQNIRGILVNISAADMGIAEFDEVGNIVHSFTPEETVIKMGTTLDESLDNKIKVTIIATGINCPQEKNSISEKCASPRFGINEDYDDTAYLDIPKFLRRT